jgi:hypothetical protein
MYIYNEQSSICSARVTPYVDYSIVIDVNPENKHMDNDISPEEIYLERIMTTKHVWLVGTTLTFNFSCI